MATAVHLDYKGAVDNSLPQQAVSTVVYKSTGNNGLTITRYIC